MWLAKVDVVLLEEVCHWGWALGFQKPTAGPVLLSQLPAHPYVELSVTSPVPCLPSCCHASCCDGNGLHLQTVSLLKLDVYQYKSCCGQDVTSQKIETLTTTNDSDDKTGYTARVNQDERGSVSGEE